MEVGDFRKVIKVTRLGGVTLQSIYSGTRYDEDPVIYREKHLKAQQNYSKIYGNEPRYNEIPAINE